MEIAATAVVLDIRAHGEHGAIVRALTRDHGLLAGYVRGGRSRAMRPILQPGNRIAARWRARTEAQLPGLTLEPVHSMAPLFGDPLAAAALAWVSALTASVLPEGHPYPHLADALDGVLAAIEAAPAARGWAVALVRYELLLLAELGFGLDLETCAVTGDIAGLAYVSPRSGRAVSRAGAVGHERKLLALPGFLIAGGAAQWTDIVAGLRLTGHFLQRDLLTGRASEIVPARARLLDRINRAVA